MSRPRRTIDGSRSTEGASDRGGLAKAAISKEVLAAGLAAAAAAISASPSSRRKIRDAGLDAADTASQAASKVVSTATELGTIIAEAVADAAKRVMATQGGVENDHSGRTAKRSATRSTRRSARSGAVEKSVKQPGHRVYEVTINDGFKVSSDLEASLVSEVEAMMSQSGGPANFDASKWVHDWVRQKVPALNGMRPIELLDTEQGRELVSTTLARMQSGAYA